MSVILLEVTTQKQQKEFVQFPLELYKDSPYFVPPLLSEELKNFDRNENPVFQHAFLKQFLAYKNNKLVGRIAVLFNENETQLQGIPKMRFGWLDFIDDEEVSKALIGKAEALAKEHKLTLVEGPMGFSNMDKTGMLSFGFEEMATMISSYNFSYYPKHLEKLGYSQEKQWIEFYYNSPKEISKIERLANLVETKYELKARVFQNKKEIEPYINELFTLIGGSYGQLSTFVPLSDNQAEYYKKKYIKVIPPEFIKCVVDKEEHLVGFAIIIPSYVHALRKAKGKLFPFGWYHLLKAQKKNDRGELILIGVLPEYRIKGVTSILFREIYYLIEKIGIKVIETNPLLHDNRDSIALWEQFNPTLHRKRCTFSKKLT